MVWYGLISIEDMKKKKKKGNGADPSHCEGEVNLEMTAQTRITITVNEIQQRNFFFGPSYANLHKTLWT